MYECMTCMAAPISASLYCWAGSRLDRMVPWKQVGSCGMIARDARSCFKGIRSIWSPSIDMQPSHATNRNKQDRRLDLPEPVLPTIPIFSPASIEQETRLRAKGHPGRYLSVRFSIAMAPADGHSGGTCMSGPCDKTTSGSGGCVRRMIKKDE